MKKIFLAILSICLLIGLPFLGILAAGKELNLYTEFPPLTQHVSHAPFAWHMFVPLAVLGVLVILLFLYQLNKGRSQAQFKTTKRPYLFPWWGWLSLFLTSFGWILAWNRFSWFAPFQPHTFLPLWLGFILIINGLTFRRTGTCLLTGRPGYFFILFPVSAGFWWFFEYLNRFVQNWYYVGIEDFSSIAYVIHASLCFSTVLPAVLSTEEFLASFPRLTEPLGSSLRASPALSSRFLFILLLLISSFGLAAIGYRPDYLFPLLWLSPLFIILAVQKISGQTTFLDRIGQGDWRPVWLPAIAALSCGFFWELWNVKSYAHWVYSIPFVQKYHIFEMPVLGYLGYLPFGLLCKAVADLTEKILEEKRDG